MDDFIDHSDFFTLDVADYIGEKADEKDLESFVDSCSIFTGRLHIESFFGLLTADFQPNPIQLK